MAPKKGFDDAGEDADEMAANLRDAQRVKGAARDDDEPEELEVGGGDDDVDDDDDSGAAPEPGQRAAKKRKRGEDMVRAANERAERLERLLEQSISAQQRQVVVQAPAPQQEQRYDPNSDPLVQEHRGIQAQIQNVTNKYHDAQIRKATAAELQAIEAESWELRERLDDNVFRRKMRQYGGGQQQPAQSPQQLEAQYAQMRLKEEHGDVLNNKQAALYCEGEWRKLLALGKPDDFATFGLAAEETRKAFRMPLKNARPAPTIAQRKRFAGVSRGGSAPAEGSNKTVKMTKERMKMADAYAPHIKDQKKRYQHWANTVGAKLED
jgi:hypothetical protein